MSQQDLHAAESNRAEEILDLVSERITNKALTIGVTEAVSDSHKRADRS